MCRQWFVLSSLERDPLAMGRCRGFAPPQTLDAIDTFRCTAANIARAQYLSVNVLDALTEPANDLPLLVPRSTPVTLNRAGDLSIAIFGTWPLAADCGARGFSQAVGLRTLTEQQCTEQE